MSDTFGEVNGGVGHLLPGVRGQRPRRSGTLPTTPPLEPCKSTLSFDGFSSCMCLEVEWEVQHACSRLESFGSPATPVPGHQHT
jgi:hypothetical protein